MMVIAVASCNAAAAYHQAFPAAGDKGQVPLEPAWLDKIVTLDPHQQRAASNQTSSLLERTTAAADHKAVVGTLSGHEALGIQTLDWHKEVQKCNTLVKGATATHTDVCNYKHKCLLLVLPP